MTLLARCPVTDAPVEVLLDFSTNIKPHFPVSTFSFLEFSAQNVIYGYLLGVCLGVGLYLGYLLVYVCIFRRIA